MTQQEQRVGRTISLVLVVSSVVVLALPLVVLGPREGLALLKDIFSLLLNPDAFIAAAIGGVLTFIVLLVVTRQISRPRCPTCGQTLPPAKVHLARPTITPEP